MSCAGQANASAEARAARHQPDIRSTAEQATGLVTNTTLSSSQQIGHGSSHAVTASQSMCSCQVVLLLTNTAAPQPQVSLQQAAGNRTVAACHCWPTTPSSTQGQMPFTESFSLCISHSLASTHNAHGHHEHEQAIHYSCQCGCWRPW